MFMSQIAMTESKDRPSFQLSVKNGGDVLTLGKIVNTLKCVKPTFATAFNKYSFSSSLTESDYQKASKILQLFLTSNLIDPL